MVSDAVRDVQNVAPDWQRTYCAVVLGPSVEHVDLTDPFFFFFFFFAIYSFYLQICLLITSSSPSRPGCPVRSQVATINMVVYIPVSPLSSAQNDSFFQ